MEHITVDKVAAVIVMARELGRAEGEMRGFIDRMDEEEQAALVTVMWIGRGAFDVDDWDEIVRINLRGIFLIQREALKAMIASKIAGSIVNMSSSMAGFDVLSGASGYAATKHAVLGLTRIAALDVARYGIRVNAVCPGVIETHLGVPATDDEGYRSGTEHFANRIPLRRIGQTEDVAAVVAFLASGDAAHVTGVGWLIDGGQTMQSWSNAPSGDRYPLG